MYYKQICLVLGKFLIFLALAMLAPLLIATYYEFFADPSTHPQPHSTKAFAITITLSLIISFCCLWASKGENDSIFRKEGLSLVALVWGISPLLGGLPFYLSGTFENFIDAWFESMSAFTTTGATVMHAKSYTPTTLEEVPIFRNIAHFHNVGYTFWGTIAPVRDPLSGKELFVGVEAVGKALLFWRSLMQWLGGMGIIVLFVAVLPALGMGGKILFQSEVTGPDKGGLTPRIKESASLLWRIYIFLTFLEIALLMLTNAQITLYEAVTIAFSNISTGGLSTKNTSIAYFNNPVTEWIVIAFMFLGSLNFALYFNIYKAKFFKIFQPEFLIFLGICLGGSSLISFQIIGENKDLLTGEAGIYSLSEAIRYGTFHFISVLSSTGFATANYDYWPYPAQIVLLLAMFIGGMSGSTSGGIKVIRHYIAFHVLKNKIESNFKPDSVKTLTIGKQEIHPQVRFTVVCFFLIVICFTVLGILLLTFDGVDPETALGTIACMTNNVGIAFRMGSPAESFAFLSNFGKLVSIFWMALGRLEFFVILVLFLPSFWKKV